MHDILFKNLTSLNHHRRDIFLSEQFEKDGVMTKTQKHFVYLVRDHALLESPEELEGWVKKYTRQGPRLKDLSVLKIYDTKKSEERFEVKIVGNLYVLRDRDIFNVDFIQVFKIDRQGQVVKE